MRSSAWPRISKQKGCTVLDMTGLAQKGGAVYSHVRIARRPEEIHAVRIAAGGARLLLGCDLVVAASADALSKLQPGSQPRDRQQPRDHHRRLHPQPRSRISQPRAAAQHRRGGRSRTIPNSSTPLAIATGLFGDSIASNLFMLGYAYQRGAGAAVGRGLERAIELNGVAVEFNQARLPLGAARCRRSGPRRGACDTAAPRCRKLTVFPKPSNR